MPKIVDKVQMRQRIVESAFRCFADRGYHASTMAHVALAAGLAKGTVYLYFDSKDALTTALVAHIFAGYEAEVAAFDRDHDTLEEFLAGLQASLWRNPAGDRATLVFFEVLGPSLAIPQARAIVGAFFGQMAQRVGRQIARLQNLGQITPHIDPYVTARALSALLDGLVTHRALFEIPETDYAAQCSAVITVFASGLKRS